MYVYQSIKAMIVLELFRWLCRQQQDTQSRTGFVSFKGFLFLLYFFSFSRSTISSIKHINLFGFVQVVTPRDLSRDRFFYILYNYIARQGYGELYNNVIYSWYVWWCVLYPIGSFKSFIRAHTDADFFFFCFICFLFCHRDKNDFQRVEDQLFQMTITAKMPEIESLKYPWGT